MEVKKIIARIAWKIYLWASEQTEAGLIFDIVQDNAEYP